MAAWSEVQWSELTHDRRLDAEYYHPDYLQQDKALASVERASLGTVASVSDGNHLSIAEKFADAGVRYLRGQDLSEFFVSDWDPAFIPEATYQELSRSHMIAGDVLIGIVGTIGTVSLVSDRFDRLTGNCKIAIVRPDDVEPEYVATYLTSRAGQNELKRRVRGSVQTGLILPDVRSLPIPLLKPETRVVVSQKVKDALGKHQEASESYDQALALIESTLRLDATKTAPTVSTVRALSDVAKAARLDAEYACVPDLSSTWHPDCELRPLSHPSISTRVSNGMTPASGDYGDEGVPIIKVGSIGVNGFAEFGGSCVKPGTKTLSSSKGSVRPGDVMVIAAAHHVKYIGKAGLLREWPDEQQRCQAVGELIVIRPGDAIRGEVLSAYLNSPAIRIQTRRLVRGMSAHLYPRDLADLPVPVIGKEVQTEIAALVNSSYEHREASRRLLEGARDIVDSAILG